MPLTSEQIEVQKLKFHRSMLQKKLVLPYLVSGQDGGNYVDNMVQNMFEIWLSAIASVEIELPEKTNEDPYGCCTYFVDVASHIEQQGYKVKP